jgi:hypothetical protein
MRFVVLAFAAIIGLAAVHGAASSDDLAPADIEAHVGQTLTVTGTVDEVFQDRRSGTIFLDMGGRYPSSRFTGVIFRESADDFPDINALEGRKVGLTGTIRLYNGRPEIVLRDAGQISAH